MTHTFQMHVLHCIKFTLHYNRVNGNVEYMNLSTALACSHKAKVNAKANAKANENAKVTSLLWVHSILNILLTLSGF